MVGEKTKSF